MAKSKKVYIGWNLLFILFLPIAIYFTMDAIISSAFFSFGAFLFATVMIGVFFCANTYHLNECLKDEIKESGRKKKILSRDIRIYLIFFSLIGIGIEIPISFKPALFINTLVDIAPVVILVILFWSVINILATG